MAVRLSALRTDRALPPRKIPGTHFCQRLSRPQGLSEAEGIKSIEKSSNLIGNRTCDLPACIIVLQPTTLPRATALEKTVLYYTFKETLKHFVLTYAFWRSIWAVTCQGSDINHRIYVTLYCTLIKIISTNVAVKMSHIKREVLGRINRLLSFDTTRTA
jgi:hypothetical protein